MQGTTSSPARPPASLVVSNVTSGYGKHTVLERVSLTVAPGRITALTGVNGAGKSTLLSTLSGQVPAREGAIALGALDLNRLSPADRVVAGLSHCPQGRRVLVSLTVEENLALGGWTRPKSELEDRRDWLFDVFPVLADKRAARGGALSGGQQQMLAIARALMSAPAVLLVDEPSMGLAPAIVAQVYGLLRELAELGIGVLLVEEHVRLIEDIADDVLLLSGGQIIVEDAQAVHADPAAAARRVLAGAADPYHESGGE
jgi:branched-chain amino acid transport system ATP-binding protein